MIYAQCVNIRAYGLLYVNKQCRNEFIPLLKEEFVLGFHIDPSSSTTVNIISPDNSAWGGRFVLDAASPHPDYSILDSMPIDRFKGIRILIDPPSMDDPGQIVRGWLQSNALVTALLPRWADAETVPRTEEDIFVPDTRLETRLPPITIQIRDSKKQKWHTEGSWNRSLSSFSAWDPVLRTAPEHERGLCDLAIILTPLARLRNADAVALELPSNAPVESGFDDFRNRLVSFGTRKKLFGLEMSKELEWNDEDIQAWEDALHVWFDYLLDDMRGPSAAQLRRDRFKYWCSEYEFQMGRRMHGLFCKPDWIGGAWGSLDDDLFDLIKKSFHDRFMSAREHILAAYRDTLRRHGKSVYIYSDKQVDFSYHHRKVLELRLWPELGNDETFWEVSYPTGIEPKSRNDNWENTEQIDLLHRLGPPESTREITACQRFPPQIARCKHCDQDRSMIESAKRAQKTVRDYLFNFSSRPGIPLLLGPIEATEPRTGISLDG
jgi:hypothetical protein